MSSNHRLLVTLPTVARLPANVNMDTGATVHFLITCRRSSAVPKTYGRSCMRPQQLLKNSMIVWAVLTRSLTLWAEPLCREQERLEKAEQARRETERTLREQRAAIDAKEVRFTRFCTPPECEKDMLGSDPRCLRVY